MTHIDEGALADELDVVEEIECYRSALLTLKAMGEVGMEPDYTKWVTFHSEVARIATEALNHQK